MATDATLPTAALLRPFLFIVDAFVGHPAKATPGNALAVLAHTAHPLGAVRPMARVVGAQLAKGA